MATLLPETSIFIALPLLLLQLGWDFIRGVVYTTGSTAAAPPPPERRRGRKEDADDDVPYVVVVVAVFSIYTIFSANVTLLHLMPDNAKAEAAVESDSWGTERSTSERTVGLR